VRTPVGKRGGRLSIWPRSIWPPNRSFPCSRATILDPAEVEDVIMGCTMTVGELGAARHPFRCASGHVGGNGHRHRGRRRVDEPGADSSTTEPGPGEAYGPMYRAHFDLIHQGECAEEIARR
jgi:hypothetical protein